jgi:hypothetical protein
MKNSTQREFDRLSYIMRGSMVEIERQVETSLNTDLFLKIKKELYPKFDKPNLWHTLLEEMLNHNEEV